MLRPTNVYIHLDRLVNNARVLREWAGRNAFFCPMIKAQAYGHGAIEAARALGQAGFKTVGVALVEEGLAIRRSGYQGQILVFGPLDGESKVAVEEFELTPVVSRWPDLETLRSAKLKSLHIKFNTGMNRLGFAPEDAPAVSEFVQSMTPNLAGVCTHLSQGADAGEEDGYTARQLKCFADVTKHFPGVTQHCLNSAALQGLQKFPEQARAALGSRPGIALYGLPSGNEAVPPELQPVLEWKTEIDVIQKVRKGQSISYSARWTAPEDSIIGIVPMGYADGYRRNLTNQGVMLFRGKRVNVVGTVCMDYTLLDLTQAAGTQPPSRGEEVVAIGEQGEEKVTAGELAQKLGTVSYEIVTNIGARVPRIFVGAT